MHGFLITVIVVIAGAMSWALINVHADRDVARERLQATIASHEQESAHLRQAYAAEIADRNARIGSDAERIRVLQDQLRQSERRLATLEHRRRSLDEALADTTLVVDWGTLRNRSQRGEIRAVERLDERTVAARLGNGLWLQADIPDTATIAQILISEAAPGRQDSDARQARSHNDPLSRTLD